MAKKPKTSPMSITNNSIMMIIAMIIITLASSSSSSSNLYVSASRSSSSEKLWLPTWSKMAAKEAEKVGAIECSGHGSAYLDGLILNGHQPVCECNSCYYGPTCSLFNSTYPAEAASGDPYFLEPFWRQRAERSGILVSGWHRMGYRYNDGSLISELLVKYIQRLHELVGNAVTHGRFIVFGAGASQLLNAAVYAFSPNSSLQSPAKVVATAPYFPLYRSQTELFNSRDNKYEGDTSLWKKNVSKVNATFIEFVTSPNNPDGKLTEAILKGPNVKTINDHAYYWPHFTPIPSPSNQDLMIFTLSKLTGHAGTRFGWALIKDEGVYQKMLSYLQTSTMGVSREAQLRALKILDIVVEESDGRDIFKFGYSTLKNRWMRLIRVLSKSKRFSLQKLVPEYDTFFKRSRDPTPAYAWVKCEREEDENCYEILKAAKIEGRGGSMYSARNHFVRLSLIGSQDDFDILINHFTKLVTHEN